MLRRFLNKIEAIYKYRYLSRNERGAYNFLLKKIHKGIDIDFLELVWQLDYFREILEPQEVDLDQLKRVLVIAPHQDDEIIGCGGSLVRLSELGCQITIGFLTDGAELSNPENSVPIRHDESKAVADKLKARLLELGINNISMSVDKDHLNELTHWLNEDWDAVFTVWPVDQPPKHRLCSYLVGKALNQSNFNGNVYLYAVHTDLLPNFFVDISTVVDRKQDLLRKYASQLKAQRLDHLSKGLDAWRSRFLPVSSEARSIETFMRIPAEAYSDFQKIYERSEKNQLFKAHEACVRAFDRLRLL